MIELTKSFILYGYYFDSIGQIKMTQKNRRPAALSPHVVIFLLLNAYSY